jgi:hypothetical protein
MNNLVHLRLINGNHLKLYEYGTFTQLSFEVGFAIGKGHILSYIGTNTFTKNKTVARHEINTAPIRASIA